jgi:hypothetical protein
MGFVRALAFMAIIKAALAETCVCPDACWPSNDAWNRLNETLGGSLFLARLPAYVCHVPTVNENACNIAKTNWTRFVLLQE